MFMFCSGRCEVGAGPKLRDTLHQVVVALLEDAAEYDHVVMEMPMGRSVNCLKL